MNVAVENIRVFGFVDRDSFNAHRAAPGRGGCGFFSVGWVKKHAVRPPVTPRAHPPSRGRRPPRHTSPQGVQFLELPAKFDDLVNEVHPQENKVKAKTTKSDSTASKH